MSDTHWALQTGDDLASEIRDRVVEHYEHLRNTGLIQLMKASHASYYGIGRSGGHESSQIIEFGEQGERLGTKSNKLRSLVRYLHTSITSERVNATPKALSKSARARAQIPAAKAVQEHYMVRKNQAEACTQMALRAILFGKGYVSQLWDPSLKDVSENGDLAGYEAHSPLEVALDPGRTFAKSDWFCLVRPRNRWDVAAVFAPEMSDEDRRMDIDTAPDPEAAARAHAERDEFRDRILSESADDMPELMGEVIGWANCNNLLGRDESDDLIEIHFFHKRTPALPQGRQAIVTAGGTLLFEGDLAYKELPLSAMEAEELVFGGSSAYTSVWDLLGLQDFRDALLGTAATNFDAFGTNDVLIPEGVEIGVEEIRDGLNVIRYPAGEGNKPSILEKTSVRDEFFKLRDWLDDDMLGTIGSNSTAMGNPEASLKSGAALALVQAQAIHAQSPMIERYTSAIEDINTKTLRNVAFMAPEEHIAYLAGEQDLQSVRAYKASSLDAIDCVEIERTPAIMRTIGGRRDYADSLLERQIINTPGQYLQALRDGRVDGLEAEACDQDLADQIKAILMTGPAVVPSKEIDPATGQPFMVVQELPVTMFDNPKSCLLAAKEVLANVEVRQDLPVVEACTTFAMHVLRVWTKAPPDFLAALDYMLPMSAQMGPPPEQGDPKGKVPDKKLNDQAPAKGSSMPSLPKPAKDPLEGQR